jgi:hypothetical protein
MRWTVSDVIITSLGGNCPVQGYGTIDGQPFYFRARWDSWRLNIGGDDVVAKPAWSCSEDYGDGPYDAGWMTQEEAIGFIRRAAEGRLAGQPSDGYSLFGNGDAP